MENGRFAFLSPLWGNVWCSS